jgi:hypothetical protein
MESPFEQAQRFAGLWMEYVSKMMPTALAFDPGKAPPEFAKQLRSMGFQSMAQYTEEFMRSPQFLEAMKQSMEMAISFRKQMNDFLTGMQHNLQGVARQDIDSLMLSVRHMETRVLESMDDIASKLEAISRRLDVLERGNKGRNGQADRETREPAETEDRDVEVAQET